MYKMSEVVRTDGMQLAQVREIASDTTHSRSVSFNYIPTLDGWRALSVLGVVFFHCLHSGLEPGSILAKLAARGHMGVDVFFAISGFLICGRLLQELRETGTISLKRFYVRRCFRIMPAVWVYLAVLAALTAVGWVRTEPWEFDSTLLFVRNYFPLFNGHVFGQFTAQFWSLGVEEHFYLLWPVTMLILGPKFRRIGWAALAISLAVFLWKIIDEAHGWFIPFGTDVDTKSDTRLDALLWGCLAAIIYPCVRERLKDSTLRRSMWILIGLGIAAADLKIPEVSLIRSIFFPALLVCTAACPNSIPGKFLELPLMRWIGRLSYSIYIWQELCTFPSLDAHSPLQRIEHLPYNIAVIFLLASTSYYLVERPLTRLGHRLTSQSNPWDRVIHFRRLLARA